MSMSMSMSMTKFWVNFKQSMMPFVTRTAPMASCIVLVFFSFCRVSIQCGLLLLYLSIFLSPPLSYDQLSGPLAAWCPFSHAPLPLAVECYKLNLKAIIWGGVLHVIYTSGVVVKLWLFLRRKPENEGSQFALMENGGFVFMPIGSLSIFHGHSNCVTPSPLWLISLSKFWK